MYPWILDPTCACRYWLGRKDIALAYRQPKVEWLSKQKVDCAHCRRMPAWHFNDPWASMLPSDWQPFKDPVTAMALADYWEECGSRSKPRILRSFAERSIR
jgi:hypothetical protein